MWAKIPAVYAMHSISDKKFEQTVPCLARCFVIACLRRRLPILVKGEPSTCLPSCTRYPIYQTNPHTTPSPSQLSFSLFHINPMPTHTPPIPQASRPIPSHFPTASPSHPLTHSSLFLLLTFFFLAAPSSLFSTLGISWSSTPIGMLPSSSSKTFVIRARMSRSWSSVNL